jgi:magnesium transporter
MAPKTRHPGYDAAHAARIGLNMLKVYRDNEGAFPGSQLEELPSQIIWIDLLNPTDGERKIVAERVGIQVPSVGALSEIETSSRLVVDREVMYLSTPVVAQADSADAFLSPVGFVVTKGVLVTVRFAELTAFNVVSERIARDLSLNNSAGVFTALLEAIVDRGADVLERLGAELDKISRSIFRGSSAARRRVVRSNAQLRRILFAIGSTGDRLALARDVLLGMARIAPFVLSIRHDWVVPEFEARLTAVGKDVTSLNDYEGQLSNKVQFLLDAVLGFISIEQNDLFKVLTIVSVVGIPPTIVVGIYGMNFKFMPELNWAWGYPIALAIVGLSALTPLLWFKWRGWFD